MINSLKAIAAAAFLLSASANAVIIAEQDFNSLDSTATFTNDAFPIGSSDNQLTNAGSFNSGGPGIDFATFWTDTRGNEGPLNGSESGDFIGVNSFTGSNSPDVAADGTAVASGVEHNFEFNDGDGQLTLLFDSVSLLGFENRTLSFDYWINDTGYESTDFFSAALLGLGGIDLFSFAEPELEGMSSADDGSANWQSFTIDLEPLIAAIGEDLMLAIMVDTNSGSENIFVDSIRFQGDAVAASEPAQLALLGIGLVGLGLARRRR